MSKFIFTGCLLVLLASFLNYPATTANPETTQSSYTETIIFPISELYDFFDNNNLIIMPIFYSGGQFSFIINQRNKPVINKSSIVLEIAQETNSLIG